jgi:periplasmic protein TonB
MSKALSVLAFLLFSLTSISQTKDAVKDSVVNIPDSVSASFPGGQEGWMQFLNKNLRFPQELIDKTRGRKSRRWEVMINFMVTKEGKLRNLQPETNFGNGLEEEAMRVLRKSPNWIPAKLKGENIDSYVRQPFVFVLEVGR